MNLTFAAQFLIEVVIKILKLYFNIFLHEKV